MNSPSGATHDDVATKRIRSLGEAIAPGRIEGLRKGVLNWTQDQCARRVRVSQRQWARWEHGDQAIPWTAWEVMCLEAGVTTDWQPLQTPPDA